MPKKGKVGKNRQDKFYQLAKEQGYRSRASFKLVQLNKRHDFLSSAAKGVIDLCAAPGGWMQVARKHMPLHAPCIGIDLVPIRPVKGCLGIQGDITSDTTKSQLKKALRTAGGDDKVDVVLNDGSPNMGKAWLQDAYTQSELTLAALKLASEFLCMGGTFVTKVFRSNDYNSLLFVMNQLFKKVNATKPSASRAESAEIYVMCIGYKAPKTIDPRFLNPKYVFRDFSDVKDGKKSAPDLILNTVFNNMKKQKRNRGGYEDGDITLFKRVSALQFCRTSRPVALLVENNEISLDVRDIAADIPREEAEQVVKLLKALPETNSEIHHCLKDLKVLSRGDFKLLLKWRKAARDKLAKLGLLEDAEDGASGEDESKKIAEKPSVNNSGESTDEEQLDEEMRKARADRLAREKRKKRKRNKAHNALQRKIDMKIVIPGDGADQSPHGNQRLFSTINSDDEQESGLYSGDSEMEHPDDYYASDDDNDNDISREKIAFRPKSDTATREAEIEAEMDHWYKEYLTRKKTDRLGAPLDSKAMRRKKKRKSMAEEAEEDDVQMNNDDSDMNVESDGDEERKLTEAAARNKKTKKAEDPIQASSRETALWFSQSVFNDESSDGGSTGVENDKPTLSADASFHAAAAKEAELLASKSDPNETEDGFEIVPMKDINALDESSESDSNGGNTSDSFHSSDYDTDEKAEMVAIGKKMRKSKRARSEVLDEAYNRYTFDDPENLPDWFADPDPFYRRRHAPVTKEEVEEMKAHIKALRNAPTKKEQEAKARRKVRLAKKMKQVNAKAASIADNEDVPANSRMKAIEDLYKKAMKSVDKSKKNRKKDYQVVKPNGRISVGKNISKGRKGGKGRVVLVDRRLKSDKRGLAKAQRTAKKK